MACIGGIVSSFCVVGFDVPSPNSPKMVDEDDESNDEGLVAAAAGAGGFASQVFCTNMKQNCCSGRCASDIHGAERDARRQGADALRAFRQIKTSSVKDFATICAF